MQVMGAIGPMLGRKWCLEGAGGLLVTESLQE